MRLLFAVKILLIADRFAQPSFFGYDRDTTNKKPYKEERNMRHVYIRGIMSLIWLSAALVSGGTGNFEMAALYVILGGVFLYTAYATWKKEKDNKGGQ